MLLALLLLAVYLGLVRVADVVRYCKTLQRGALRGRKGVREGSVSMAYAYEATGTVNPLKGASV